MFFEQAIIASSAKAPTNRASQGHIYQIGAQGMKKRAVDQGLQKRTAMGACIYIQMFGYRFTNICKGRK